MRHGIERRLEDLEKSHGDEPLVSVSFQWMTSDGVPFGPLIRRLVPKDRFGWLNETRS